MLLPEDRAPLVRQVRGLRARSLGGNGQGLVFVSLELLGNGRVSGMILRRFGADKS